jgi:hypothetical protein
MNAIEIVRLARAAGIGLALDGEGLLLEAASEPSRSVIEELMRHKPEIVELLQSDHDRLEGRQPPGRSGPYGDVTAKLRLECPARIEPCRWQRAIKDADSFLDRWGQQAHSLGWTARELFGLHTLPVRPAPSYSRLSRYDETGLIWLLNGRPVVALTEATAAIRHPNGNIITYRKHNKPALGPLGDSLDDLGPCA